MYHISDYMLCILTKCIIYQTICCVYSQNVSYIRLYDVYTHKMYHISDTISNMYKTLFSIVNTA